jgi:hypothetical protein
MKLSILVLAAAAFSVMGVPIQDVSKQIEQKKVSLLQSRNAETYDDNLLMLCGWH